MPVFICVFRYVFAHVCRYMCAPVLYVCLCFKDGSPNGYFTGLLYSVKAELDSNLFPP